MIEMYKKERVIYMLEKMNRRVLTNPFQEFNSTIVL